MINSQLLSELVGLCQGRCCLLISSQRNISIIILCMVWNIKKKSNSLTLLFIYTIYIIQFPDYDLIQFHKLLSIFLKPKFILFYLIQDLRLTFFLSNVFPYMISQFGISFYMAILVLLYKRREF